MPGIRSTCALQRETTTFIFLTGTMHRATEHEHAPWEVQGHPANPQGHGQVVKEG